MSPLRAASALTFHRIGRADLDSVLDLDIDSRQIVEFLGPVPEILCAVRAGLAHSVVGFDDPDGLVGFFVLHPDARDQSCWWLGWFAIDRPHQGRGYGRAALEHALSLLAHIDGCRCVRLLVADANAAARHLYARAGFREAGRDDEGWHILEFTVHRRAQPYLRFSLYGFAMHRLPSRRVRRRFRLRPHVGPYAARTIGPVRGPPARLSLRPAASAVPHGRAASDHAPRR